MKRRLFNLAKFFMVACFFFPASCRKEDKPQPSPPVSSPETALLKSIDQDADNYLHLEHTGADVTKLKLAKDGFLLDYRFTYNTSGKPVEAILWGNHKYLFFYSGGQLNKVEYYDNLDATLLAGYLTFQYKNNRLVQTTDYYANGDGSFLEDGKTVYTYYPNGDVRFIIDSTLSSYPFHFVLEKQRAFEYDDKPNPFKAAPEVFYALALNFTPHNVTKETEYNAIYDVAETRSYQYQYDSNKLLVKAIKTITADGQPTQTKTVTYTY